MIEVIIVKYGQREYEDETVQSVMANTDLPYHLTVYDNFPGDENLSVVWNRLIERSNAQYICLLNSDTVVPKGWLERLMREFETYVWRDDDVFLTKFPEESKRAGTPCYDFEKFKKAHELLASYNQKHLIAIIASDIDAHPELVSYINSRKEEFIFAIHGWKHNDYAKLQKNEIISDLKKAQNKIKEVFKVVTKTVCVPWNHTSPQLEEALKDLGMHLTDNFTSPGDILEGTPARTVNFHSWHDVQVADVKKLLEKTCNVGAVGPISNHAGGHQGGHKGPTNKVFDGPMLSGFCLLFPKSVWKEVGGFNEKYHLYGEDSEFCSRIFNTGKKLRTVYDVWVYHYGAKSTESATRRGKDITAIQQKASDQYQKYVQTESRLRKSA